MTQIHLYSGDLPADIKFPKTVAIDAEMMGLNIHRDRLCLIQIGDGMGNAWLVQIKPKHPCPHLTKLLTDPKTLKIFHYAPIDVAMILQNLGVVTAPVYCTKIASKLCRTYAPSHGLKALAKDLLGIELSKEQQLSDWGADTLTPEQQSYAAADVLHLHALKDILDPLLAREGRTDLAKRVFDFIPTRAELEILNFTNPDIFEH